jgi:DNA repair protein RecO (recombination protein O)
MLERTEGIVLRSLDYKERQRIVTVVTERAGVISLIAKGLGGVNRRFLLLLTPLSRSEFVYERGRSDLFRFHDGTLLDAHLPLRASFAHLQTAGALAQALLRAQMPGRVDPPLYHLFAAFLKRIPVHEEPTTLVAGFRLKLLQHEGLLARGTALYELAAARRFSAFDARALPPSLCDQIEAEFQAAFG